MIRRPPSSPLFPYPPLSRSGWVGVALDVALRAVAQPPFQLVGVGARHLGEVEGEGVAQVVRPQRGDVTARVLQLGVVPARSEEHTSELQSRQYLVCRLLLEK